MKTKTRENIYVLAFLLSTMLIAFAFVATGSSRGPPRVFHIAPSEIRTGQPLNVQIVLKSWGMLGSSGMFSDIQLLYVDASSKEVTVDDITVTRGLQMITIDAVLPSAATNGLECSYILQYRANRSSNRRVFGPYPVSPSIEATGTP